MSVIFRQKTEHFEAVVERFNSAQEVVDVCNERRITDDSFDDVRKEVPSNSGVRSFAEAQQMMRTGYQPTVDKMKSGIKANVQGQSKRTSFRNEIVGFQPVIPLALQGVPNCMVNCYMKPMKSKVLNIYYDMTASWGTSSEAIIRAGQNILAAIMELEMQGYKFNLWAIQSYYDRWGSDKAYILCTKIKSANTPLDLKRISFPLTHTAYFRVIGWDWYSRCPAARYIDGYGCGLGYKYSASELSEDFEKIFKEKCVYFSAAKIIGENADHIKEVLTSGKN